MQIQSLLALQPLGEVARAHGLRVSFSADARKLGLTYDERLAREDDPVASSCRGLVLARTDGGAFALDRSPGPTTVVARPFDRFFHHGQGGTDVEAMLARPGTRVLDKPDGTLTTLYFDAVQSQWHVATRGAPEADRVLDGFCGRTDRPMTFRALFERALQEAHGLSFARFTAPLDPGLAYPFELTSPFNRVGLNYPRCELRLLGARRPDGTEVDPYTGCPEVPVPRPEQYPGGSLTAVRERLLARPAEACEGVVVVTAAFARGKVKHPGYRNLQAEVEPAMRSPRRLLELVLAGRLDDALPVLPFEVGARGEAIRARLATATAVLDAAYARLTAASPPGDRPAFVAAVKREGLPLHPLVARYAGQCDGLLGWIDQHRREGGWHNAFLDSLTLRLDALAARTAPGGPDVA